MVMVVMLLMCTRHTQPPPPRPCTTSHFQHLGGNRRKMRRDQSPNPLRLLRQLSTSLQPHQLALLTSLRAPPVVVEGPMTTQMTPVLMPLPSTLPTSMPPGPRPGQSFPVRPPDRRSQLVIRAFFFVSHLVTRTHETRWGTTEAFQARQARAPAHARTFIASHTRAHGMQLQSMDSPGALLGGLGRAGGPVAVLGHPSQGMPQPPQGDMGGALPRPSYTPPLITPDRQSSVGTPSMYSIVTTINTANHLTPAKPPTPAAISAVPPSPSAYLEADHDAGTWDEVTHICTHTYAHTRAHQHQTSRKTHKRHKV